MSFSIDYRNFSPEGQQKEAFNYEWWTEPQATMPESISGVVNALQQAQTQLDTQTAISVRLYGNAPLFGLNGLTYAKLPINPAIRDRITYNLVQSVVDAITAKIAKNRPRPLYLTNGGNAKQQRKAKKLNQFMDGVFFENRAHRKGPVIFRDGCVIGAGITHVYDEYGRVCYERVTRGQIVVDQREAMHGPPRQMHRLLPVDRRMMIAKFPSRKNMLLKVNRAKDETYASTPNVSDQIVACESWHLKSGPKAKDGIHTICCDEGLLFSEPWDNDFFPFAIFNWSEPIYGFWGQSLVEQIQNIQLEINKLLWVIQRSMHLAGSFKILVENTSKIVKAHLNNDIGTIVNYTGTPPQYVTPPIIPQEMYAHLASLKQAGYEQAGISMLSASSQKPAGLDSGRALREYNDIESERFSIVGEAYQQYFMDLARLTHATAREIVKKNKHYEVRVPSSKFIESIDFKDVDMEDDEFVMQMYPVSSLPSEPAGRLQTIQEYIQAGFLDQRQGRRLLDFPDLQQIESLANAVENRITGILDRIVDEGEYTPPDQYMDLQMARELALETYNDMVGNDLEEERLDLLRNFMTQVDDLQMKAASTQVPPAADSTASPVPNPTAPMPPGAQLQ